MAGSGLLGKLKQFDAYPKTLEDFRIKTYGGAASKLEMSCTAYSLNILKFDVAMSFISCALQLH